MEVTFSEIPTQSARNKYMGSKKNTYNYGSYISRNIYVVRWKNWTMDYKFISFTLSINIIWVPTDIISITKAHR